MAPSARVCGAFVVLVALAVLAEATPTRSYASCAYLYTSSTISYRLYWTINGANIDMALDGTNVGTATWLGMGVGTAMAGSDYAVGYLVGATSVVRDMNLPAGSNHVIPTNDAAQSFTNQLVTQVGSTMSVEWTRPLAGTGQDSPISTTAATSIIWAYSGPNGAAATATSDFAQHNNRGARSISFGTQQNCTLMPPPPPGAGGGAAPAPPAPGSWCLNGFCVYFLVQPSLGIVNLTIAAPVSGWAAFGLTGTSGSMVPADMYIAWVTAAGVAVVSDRFASARSEPAADTVQNVAILGGSLVNGQMSVKFSRPLVTGDTQDRDIVNSNMNIVYGTAGGAAPGALQSSSIAKHSDTGSGGVNFFTGATKFDKSKKPLRIAHGVLMTLAWVFFVPSGTLIARYFKNALGVWWFRIHVVLQSLAVVFTLIGFWIAVAFVPPAPHFAGPNKGHEGLGLFVFLASLLQLVFGVLADRMWSPHRTSVPIFPDMVHWGFGYILAFLGFVNCCLGFKAYGSPAWVYAVCILSWIAFFAAHIALHFIKGQSHHKESGPVPDNGPPPNSFVNGRPAAAAGAGAGVARAAPAAPAPAPAASRNETVVALYDFKTDAADELPFVEGDVIQVSAVHDDGWATGTLRGRVGVFPYAYTQARPQPPPPAAARPAINRPGPPPPGGGAAQARPTPAGRPGPPPPAAGGGAKFAKGDRVTALFAGDGGMYPAVVARMAGPASVVVVFEGYEPTEETVAIANVRKA